MIIVTELKLKLPNLNMSHINCALTLKIKSKICITFLFFSILEQAIVGYLHNLSPIKTRKSNNQYFDLQIQTSNEVYRTVCFSPDKHPLLKRKLESSIHKYQLTKNERSGENDLILNERTKIGDPDDSETDFDYVSVKTETTQATDAAIEEIHDGAAHTLINIMGRLIFSGSKETLQVKRKTLTKQEAIFTDNTGSIRVVL